MTARETAVPPGTRAQPSGDPAAPVLLREVLLASIARLLRGVRHVAVGASSPAPAGGAMLARALAEQAGGRMRISILGSAEHNFFTNGSAELFDCAGQGRIDAFFLGGGQIDGQGNVNLVGTGSYPQTDVRWPGSFGSAYLYYVVPRVILFREEHSPRVLVEQAEFISAPGSSPPGLHRPGGPVALLTGKCLFAFDRDTARFRLASLHPGVSLEEVRDLTGFAFEHDAEPPQTALPGGAELALLRGRVRQDLSGTYPAFAASWGAELNSQALC